MRVDTSNHYHSCSPEPRNDHEVGQRGITPPPPPPPPQAAPPPPPPPQAKPLKSRRITTTTQETPTPTIDKTEKMRDVVLDRLGVDENNQGSLSRITEILDEKGIEPKDALICLDFDLTLKVYSKDHKLYVRGKEDTMSTIRNLHEQGARFLIVTAAGTSANVWDQIDLDLSHLGEDGAELKEILKKTGPVAMTPYKNSNGTTIHAKDGIMLAGRDKPESMEVFLVQENITPKAIFFADDFVVNSFAVAAHFSKHNGKLESLEHIVSFWWDPKPLQNAGEVTVKGLEDSHHSDYSQFVKFVTDKIARRAVLKF